MGIGTQRYLGDRIKIPRSLSIFQSIIPKLWDEQFKQKIRMSIPCFENISYNRYKPIPFSITIMLWNKCHKKKGGVTCFKHPLLESRSAY
jgi:hypothetical protein